MFSVCSFNKAAADLDDCCHLCRNDLDSFYEIKSTKGFNRDEVFLLYDDGIRQRAKEIGDDLKFERGDSSRGRVKWWDGLDGLVSKSMSINGSGGFCYCITETVKVFTVKHKVFANSACSHIS